MNAGNAVKAPSGPKGPGPVTHVRIEKAANGHTMQVHRQNEYRFDGNEQKPMVYGDGDHEKMLGDLRTALKLPGAKAGKAKMPAPVSKAVAGPIAASIQARGGM